MEFTPPAVAGFWNGGGPAHFFRFQGSPKPSQAFPVAGPSNPELRG